MFTQSSKVYQQQILDTLREEPDLATKQINLAKRIIEKYQLDLDPVKFSRSIKNCIRNAGGLAAILQGKHVKAKAAEVPSMVLIAAEIEQRKENAAYRMLKGKYDAITEELIKTSNSLEAALLIKEFEPTTEFIPDDLGKEGSKNLATAIIQWSDWHVEEVVNPSTVNGLNKFSPEIAKKRAFNLGQNTVKVLRSVGASVEIEALMVHLGGDFFTSYLRDHDMQDNAMTPIEGMFFAYDLLIGSLDFLFTHSKAKRFHLVFNRGNHPRLTKKMQPGNDYKMNLEQILYHMIIQRYKADGRVFFSNPDSTVGYFNLYDKRIRHIHGWEVTYNGGVGGLTIPLNKKVSNWDKTISADFTMMCHYHQCYKPLRNAMLNGSLIGYNAFAQMLAAAYEPPAQSFQLLDRKRGFTFHTPIYCD